MRKIIILVVTILCVVMMSFSVFAHPGSLDDNGGHYDHSAGEYHYHHGYPAHSHEGGSCPYEFNDNTDRTNHGSSGSGKSYYEDFTKSEGETHITDVGADKSNDKSRSLYVYKEDNSDTIIFIVVASVWVILMIPIVLEDHFPKLYDKLEKQINKITRR